MYVQASAALRAAAMVLLALLAPAGPATAHGACVDAWQLSEYLSRLWDEEPIAHGLQFSTLDTIPLRTFLLFVGEKGSWTALSVDHTGSA
jgi:hypothetical protein